MQSRAHPNAPGARWGEGWHATGAAALLTGLILVFLWTPLTTNGIYAAADNLQAYSLLRVAPPDYAIANPLLLDTAVDELPWLFWSGKRIRAGELPLWNPYNSAGVPYLGNIQTAVLSPFSLPFYVLSLRAALLVTAFAKLFTLGFSMYLFLRRVGLAFGPALVGMCIYTFAGSHLIEISWSTVAVATMLPAALLCVTDAAAIPLVRRGRYTLSLLGLAVSIAVGLFGGHPETFAFASLLIGAFVLFTVFEATPRERTRRFFAYSGAVIGGCALAAVQLLPFLEYLAFSAVFGQRDTTVAKQTYPLVSLPIGAFPHLLGSPVPYDRYYSAGFYNFVGRNASYLGLAALVLSGVGVGVVLVRRGQTRVPAFFAAVALVWTLVLFDIGHAAALFAITPFLRTMLVYRGAEIGIVSGAVLAAFGVQHCLYAPPSVRRAVAVAAWGVGLTGGMIGGAVWLLGHVLPRVRAMDARFDPRAVAPHIVTVSAVTLALVLVLAVATSSKQPGAWVRGVTPVVCVLAIFAQTGLLLRYYVPTVDSHFVYPMTPPLTALMQRTGDDLTLGLDGATIPEDSNLVYGVHNLGNYDVLGVRPYETLMNALLPRVNSHLSATVTPESTRALQLFGVQYVATYTPVPFAMDANPGTSDTSAPVVLAVLPQTPIVQTFRVARSDFTALTIRFGTYGRTNTCALTFAVDDITANAPITRETRQCRDIGDGSDIQLTFAAQTNSATHIYQLSIASANADLNNCVAAFGVGTLGDGELQYAKITHPNRLLMTAQATRTPGLTRVSSRNGLNLFVVPDSLPRYYTVARAIVIPDDATTIATLRAPAFDPARTVLLATGTPTATDGSTEAESTVTVRQETPERVRVRVERGSPGWFVALQSWYPGWRATVNGVPTPITRANVAFRAVPVPAGTSEVMFEYVPTSVRVGIAVSAATGVGIVVLTALSVIWERRRPLLRDTDYGHHIATQ